MAERNKTTSCEVYFNAREWRKIERKSEKSRRVGEEKESNLDGFSRWKNDAGEHFGFRL